MTVGDKKFLQQLWDIRNLVKDEWVPDMFVALWPGSLRCGELLERIRSTSVPHGWSDSETPNRHGRVMGETLKRLKVVELVVHTQDEQAFPPVSLYSLSPEAEELFVAREPLVLWAEKHGDLIEQRRHGEGGK